MPCCAIRAWSRTPARLPDDEQEADDATPEWRFRVGDRQSLHGGSLRGDNAWHTLPMPCSVLPFARPWRGTLTLGAVALALACAPTWAQQVYRQVDGSGRVTFTDKPPSAQGGAVAASGSASSGSDDGAALPYALRQVVQRYPVTLYTRSDCQPCDAGRSLLVTRGVPYTERTIATPQDGAALQRLTGQNGLPVVTIGSQQLLGFLDGEWSQYLDAAGYPPSSQLPPGYRQSAPAPLVAVAAPPVDAQAPAASPVAPAAPPPAPVQGPTPENPAGIRF